MKFKKEQKILRMSSYISPVLTIIYASIKIIHSEQALPEELPKWHANHQITLYH